MDQYKYQLSERSFLAKRKFLAKKKFLAKNGEKYAILIDFGNFCYGKIITKKWKLEVKVIISRQFYFEISGIRLEGGKHINSKEKQAKQSLTDS